MKQRMIAALLLVSILAACSGAAVPAAEVRVAPPTALAAAPTDVPTLTLPPAPTSEPTATAIPATATPSPTEEPRAPRVGVQVGHWKTEELPDELERFRTSTGAFAAGISEVEVNLPVAERVVAILQANGVEADLLPATVPVRYQADAFISIHADGSTSAGSRGFKMATPWRTSAAGQALLNALDIEYAAGTQLPRDGAITVNMRGYYAFGWRRHQHAIASTTPAVIIEMGFLTNAADRDFMLYQPDVIAQSIANGVLRYLSERDPSDKQALVPIEYDVQRPVAGGVVVHAGPSASASVVGTMEESDRFVPFRQVDGWYEGVVRGQWRLIGWVPVSSVERTDERLPPPTGN